MTRLYRPKRARARWLDGAPDWVLSVHDFGGDGDRYTILLGGSEALHSPPVRYADSWVSYITSTGYGSISSGEFTAHQCAGFRYRVKRIRWLDLPPDVRDAAVARVAWWNEKEAAA